MPQDLVGAGQSQSRRGGNPHPRWQPPVPAGLLALASHRLPGWPLHPAGLAIALTNTVSIDWFGMFLAWLIKLIVLRYGGVLLYRKTRPFFIGLILGTCIGIGGASLVYSFYYI